MTKDEATIWLKEFMKEVDTQDNRGSARPVQFLLNHKHEYIADPNYANNTCTVFRHYEMDFESFRTRNECIKWLKEGGYTGKELQEKIDEIQELEVGHYWETSQAFFTKRGVRDHIELNGHNLRKEYRDYVIHPFRNPEMVDLFKAIRAMINDEVEQ